MKRLDGKVVVITGAGSGIGRALAENLAAKGALLALSDVDEAGLAETVRLVSGSGTKVRSDRLDVADRDAFSRYALDVVEGSPAEERPEAKTKTKTKTERASAKDAETKGESADTGAGDGDGEDG